jgi:hypothetical protein
VSHHPGSESSLLRSSSSGAATGWLLITIRDKARPNSEVTVAPLAEPTQQAVSEGRMHRALLLRCCA